MASTEYPAVTNFREYIRINTAQPNPDYDTCVKWLTSKATEAGGSVAVVECTPGKPAVIVTFTGLKPELPSILLNSHMDVVPVFPEHWKYDPFSAHKEENGDIYGRGSQDMKCVGIQYLEAIKKLKQRNASFMRTIHLTYMPEEELGGVRGMKEFVKLSEFKSLNIGFALDEGYASPSDKYYVFYGERNVWRFFVRCPGNPGHGSQFIADTAAQKLRKVIDKFLSFREEEEKKLLNNSNVKLGDVTTLNLTLLEGGVQFNVVPACLSAGFDVRVALTENLVELETRFNNWCQEISKDITIDFKEKCDEQSATCVEDGKNAWWDTFSNACKNEGIAYKKRVFPASTDSKYLRPLGIPALGFSPMNKTPILLHDHNEFLNESVFLRGIDIYCTIIEALANQSQ